jgi:GTP-binding protein EngB required for normal cell division
LGEDQKELLDLIDRLRGSGSDKVNLDLPQLIVAGDQSAGKSSLLAALSHFEFPAMNKRCTRFATQIKMRHDIVDQDPVVTIVPDPNSSNAERARLERFGRELPRGATFREIFQRATETICQPPEIFWSKHKLNIELAGPTLLHLTIVDLPGFIHVGDRQEIEAIKSLAMEYMRNPRSIVVAVVSAASDRDLQFILTSEMRQYDSNGERTIGVITKPDTIENHEKFEEFLSLARSNTPFRLGWHVVRNRTPRENDSGVSLDQVARDEKNFFAENRGWEVLGKENIGIGELRKKLNKALVDRIRRELPKLVAETEEKLETCEAELMSLGPARDTPETRQEAMEGVFRKSRQLAELAMSGQYQDPPGIRFFHNTAHQLLARIITTHHTFAQHMIRWGHSFEIEDTPAAKPKKQATWAVPSRARLESKTRAEAIKHVEHYLLAHPGREPVTHGSPMYVLDLFREHSESWNAIAMQYVETIYGICREFWRGVFKTVWPKDMGDRAWTPFVDDVMRKRRAGAMEVLRLLERDRINSRASYDPEYKERYNDWYHRRTTPATKIGPQPTRVVAGEMFLEAMLIHYNVRFGARHDDRLADRD